MTEWTTCGFDGGTYQRTVVHAHEIGHNFGGDHPYAVEDPPGSGKWTIMDASFHGSNTQDWFSDGTLDSAKNNVRRMRALSDTVIATYPIYNLVQFGGGGTASCAPKYGEHPLGAAMDGSTSTYWWASTTPCSVTFSFPSAKHLTKFVMREYSQGTLITSFSVDVDTTGNGNWVQVYQDTAATAWTYVGAFKVITAYKIRFNINAVCCGYTAVVLEFEAYHSENLALQSYGAQASATSYYWGHVASLSNDGNLATYWWAAPGDSTLTLLFDKAYATSKPRTYPITQIVVRAYSSAYALSYWDLWILAADGSWHSVDEQHGGQGVVKIFIIISEGYFSNIQGFKLNFFGPTCCGGLNDQVVITEIEAYADNHEPLTGNSLRWFYEYS